MEITFLGTSSMVPTKERNQSGVFLKHGTEGVLFDCGEGIQRQMKVAGLKLTSITRILLSHWHGDHVLGLPGLLQSMSASEYGKTLELYGPKGTKKHMEHLFQAFVFDRKIDITVNEVSSGLVVDAPEFTVEALPLEHGVKTLGYSFIEKDKRKMNERKLAALGAKGPIIGQLQRGESVVIKGKKVHPDDVSSVVKGRKIVYITDTRLCENCFALAHNADVLICESTYASSLEGKGEEYSHMTASQAAEIASRSGVGRLYLTHFSARYKNVDEMEEEAKEKFENVVCAHDFLTIKV